MAGGFVGDSKVQDVEGWGRLPGTQPLWVCLLSSGKAEIMLQSGGKCTPDLFWLYPFMQRCTLNFVWLL